MGTLAVGVVMAAALAWAVLWLDHDRFWRITEWLPRARERRRWPAVAAIVPARDEAGTIHTCVHHLLGQHYDGQLHLVVVDDRSEDATAAHAKAGADVVGMGHRLTVVGGSPRPAGWTGKVWAMEQGWRALREHAIPAAYVWFTDADIAHAGHTLQRLVDYAERDRRDLVSLMVTLTSVGRWAELLVPAFVYFFRKLYPFAKVNDPQSRWAAAAGGCMLVHKPTLEMAGGPSAIRGQLIDDCALARVVRRAGTGRIWLGMTLWSRSLRPVRGLGDAWTMVVRSAFAQLNHRVSALVGTVIGMTVLYAVPPAAALSWPWHGHTLAGGLGLAAWLAMSRTFAPMLAAYDVPRRWAVLLPVAGLVYTLMTLDSARRHWLGRGGAWKGRTNT